MSKDKANQWAVYYLANDEGTYGENAGKPIITTADGEHEITGIVYDEDDAALIAAAPEMLQELKRLVSILEDVDPDALQLTAWGLTCMLKPARELITKAEGSVIKHERKGK